MQLPDLKDFVNSFGSELKEVKEKQKMIEENFINEQKHPQKATESFNVEGQPDEYQLQPDFVVELSQKIEELSTG